MVKRGNKFSMGKERLKKLNEVKRLDRLDRYSPWRSEELEDELIV